MIRVGSGKADITPPVGLPLSGFAVRQNRPSVAIDDALSVKALALESGAERYLLLSYDLLGFDAELDASLRAALQSAFGARLPDSQVLITTTHTHSAPPTMPIAGETRVPEPYIQKILAATLAAASAAFEGLAEAQLFHACTHLEGINHNRRRYLLPAEGPERFPLDNSLDWFVFKTPQGACLGSLLRFACHAVTMTDQHVSADFPGELTRRLEAQLGAPVLYLQGASGDANPTTQSRDHAAMLAFVDAIMPQLADLPGRLAPVALEQVRLAAASFPLEFAPLPGREAVLAKVAQNERILAGDQTSADLQPLLQEYSTWRYASEPVTPAIAVHWAAVFKEVAQVTLKAVEASDEHAGAPFRAVLWQLGPFPFVFLSGEILTSVGRRIQALAPEKPVQVIGYLSPVVGYIAGPDDNRLGGYETDAAWRWYHQPGPFREDVEETVLAQVRALLG